MRSASPRERAEVFSSSRVIPSTSAKVFFSRDFSAFAFANEFLGVRFQPIFCRDGPCPLSDGSDRCAPFRQTRRAFDSGVLRWTTHFRFSPVLAFFPRTYLDRSDLRFGWPFPGVG